MNEHYALCFGNPCDGFDYVGPFSSKKEATEYADQHLARGHDWWLILLQAPAKE